MTVNEAWWAAMTGCLRLANAIRSSHTVIWERGRPVQCVGHADLLLHPTVGWLLACLGIRETPGEEPGETFSYCGRETFVAPVVWQHNPVSWKLDGGEPNKRIDIVDPGCRSWLRGLAGFPRSWSWTLTRMDCHVQ